MQRVVALMYGLDAADATRTPLVTSLVTDSAVTLFFEIV